MARPKGSGGKARALTHQEIQRVDKCLTGTRHEQRNRLILYLGLGSGLRISEMTNLRVKDVAPFGLVVDQVTLEKHSTKSGRSRTVHLSPQAIRYLKKYLAHRGITEGDAPLFPSQKSASRSLTANAAVKILTRMFKEAAIQGASSHSLRRTHANELRRTGADLKLIQDQLGHSSLAITECYFDVDPLEKKIALSKLKF